MRSLLVFGLALWASAAAAQSLPTARQLEPQAAARARRAVADPSTLELFTVRSDTIDLASGRSRTWGFAYLHGAATATPRPVVEVRIMGRDTLVYDYFNGRSWGPLLPGWIDSDSLLQQLYTVGDGTWNGQRFQQTYPDARALVFLERPFASGSQTLWLVTYKSDRCRVYLTFNWSTTGGQAPTLASGWGYTAPGGGSPGGCYPASTGINERDATAVDFVSVAPNPASGPIAVTYRLAETTPVRVSILDARGREVARLTDATQPPGLYHTTWSPAGLAAGLYVVHVQTPTASETRKVLVARP